MTINELEQGLRNLIATQPMVTAGPVGEVVNCVLSMIDAFRNLSFKIQSYPAQDVLKFNMLNESQKLENNFSNWVCQVMQERGINLMLYIPRNQPQMAPMVNQYGMITNQPIDQSMMMGQMMYQAAPQQNMGMMNQMAQPVQMMPQGGYNQMQPTMQMMGQQPVQPNGRAPRRQAATFPGYGNQAAPTRLEPNSNPMMRPQAASQTKIKTSPKVSAAQPEMHRSSDQNIQMAPATSPAEEMMSGGSIDVDATKSGGGKAAGRDYLMELLKK